MRRYPPSLPVDLQEAGLPEIWLEPLPVVIKVLTGQTTVATVHENLPEVKSSAHDQEEYVMDNATTLSRCAWAGNDPLYRAYHDEEWGVPVHDDRLLFEFLILEGAQAGLSWLTILRKRATYRLAFAGFDPELVARFDEAKVAELLVNPGIVRNRLKVASAISNARAFLKMQEEFGSFNAYQWRFVDGNPIVNAWGGITEVPARTSVSDAMSRDLKKRGFRFVGSTICYAHMQAVGMVNDHTVDCFRWRQLGGGGHE